MHLVRPYWSRRGDQIKMLCPYCGAEVVLKTAYEIYGSEKSKNWGYVWVCSNFPECNSYVGCHKGTTIPLGRLANPRLRELKREAHRQFDPLWKSGLMSRSHAYHWLSDVLNIKFDECHIGLFDIKQCQKVIHLCRKQHNSLVNAYRKSHYSRRKFQGNKGYRNLRHN